MAIAADFTERLSPGWGAPFDPPRRALGRYVLRIDPGANTSIAHDPRQTTAKHVSCVHRDIANEPSKPSSEMPGQSLGKSKAVSAYERVMKSCAVFVCRATSPKSDRYPAEHPATKRLRTGRRLFFDFISVSIFLRTETRVARHRSQNCEIGGLPLPGSISWRIWCARVL